MMNYNRKNKANDVNGMSSQARHVSSGSGYVEDQATYDRQPVTGTTRRKYSREDNKAVMECYFKSRPGVMGYRKRMYELLVLLLVLVLLLDLVLLSMSISMTMSMTV